MALTGIQAFDDVLMALPLAEAALTVAGQPELATLLAGLVATAKAVEAAIESGQVNVPAATAAVDADAAAEEEIKFGPKS